VLVSLNNNKDVGDCKNGVWLGTFLQIFVSFFQNGFMVSEGNF
jgi:hypothetical protein